MGSHTNIFGDVNITVKIKNGDRAVKVELPRVKEPPAGYLPRIEAADVRAYVSKSHGFFDAAYRLPQRVKFLTSARVFIVKPNSCVLVLRRHQAVPTPQALNADTDKVATDHLWSGNTFHPRFPLKTYLNNLAGPDPHTYRDPFRLICRSVIRKHGNGSLAAKDSYDDIPKWVDTYLMRGPCITWVYDSKPRKVTKGKPFELIEDTRENCRQYLFHDGLATPEQRKFVRKLNRCDSRKADREELEEIERLEREGA